MRVAYDPRARHLTGLLSAVLPPGTILLPNNRRVRTMSAYDRRARYLTGLLGFLGDDSDPFAGIDDSGEPFATSLIPDTGTSSIFDTSSDYGTPTTIVLPSSSSSDLTSGYMGAASTVISGGGGVSAAADAASSYVIANGGTPAQAAAAAADVENQYTGNTNAAQNAAANEASSYTIATGGEIGRAHV